MKQVSDKLFVSPQVTRAELMQAQAAGIAAIVNNRPDGEEPGQPSAASNAAIAAELELGYTHIPVAPGQYSLEQVRALQAAIAAAEGPVLAHCKTGTRSASLYAIGKVLDGRMTKEDVTALGQSIGLDLSGAVRWLDANASN